MNNAPRWSDQPEFERFNQLIEMLLPDVTMVQVAEVTYRGREGIAISAGNLFGSQTILVRDHREALLAVAKLQETCRALERCKNDTQRERHRIGAKSHGWEFLPNKEKASAEKERETAQA